uniref:Coiled-coil domain-containing protein 1-like n=1 Tax=Elaeis guineensis var. tenera TaxID=51953 RepID=A0A6I9QNF9_ELAGV
TESDELGNDSNEDDDDDGIRDLRRDIGSFFNDCPVEKNLGASTDSKAPDRDIDIYLKPLVDELNELWDKDIIQLDYVKGKSVVLFKYKWYDLESRNANIRIDGNVQSINVTRLCATTEEDSVDEEDLEMSPADIEEYHIESLDRDDVEPDIVDNTLLNTMQGLHYEVGELAIRDNEDEDDTLVEYCIEDDDQQNDDDNDHDNDLF